MKTAFLFPGQGAQVVGMGVDIAEQYPEAKAIFEQASDIAGYDMKALCAEGPADKLSQTSFTQPAMFTVEAAITAVLKSHGVVPDCTAGHSLGEFGAWFAAGVYTFEQGFKLVSERGRIMDGADPDGVGAMSAVIGLDIEDVREICHSVDGIVVVANINSPVQVVISGEKDAVSAAGAKLKDAGAKRVLPLKVSGAFHSPLMDAAREEFAKTVYDMDLMDASVPVYTNVTALQATAAAEIRGLMVEQLISPVRWTELVGAMVQDGVTNAYEIGPGAVLAGLIKRIDRNLGVVNISDVAQLGEVVG